MMNFVIVSSNNNHKFYENVIDREILPTNYQYKCHKFNGSDNKFEKFLAKHERRMLYIIENGKNIDALKIIKSIRFDHEDIISFIIVVDPYCKLKQDDVNKIFAFNSVVLSLNSKCEQKLSIIINQLLLVYKHDKKTLSYKYDGAEYRILFSNILYIKKVTNTKLCIIKCKIGEYYINKSLYEISKMLDNRFIRPSRSKITNRDNVIKYNIKNKLATFENEEIEKRIQK